VNVTMYLPSLKISGLTAVLRRTDTGPVDEISLHGNGPDVPFCAFRDLADYDEFIGFLVARKAVFGEAQARHAARHAARPLVPLDRTTELLLDGAWTDISASREPLPDLPYEHGGRDIVFTQPPVPQDPAGPLVPLPGEPDALSRALIDAQPELAGVVHMVNGRPWCDGVNHTTMCEFPMATYAPDLPDLSQREPGVTLDDPEMEVNERGMPTGNYLCMLPDDCPLGPEPHAFVPPEAPGMCCTRQPWEADPPVVKMTPCPGCGVLTAPGSPHVCDSAADKAQHDSDASLIRHGVKPKDIAALHGDPGSAP